MKYREAIAQATLELMQRDDRVLVLGEGVCDPKHIFGTTALAHEAFPDRVIETPLSENMLTGALAGLALEGYRPIYVHARAEFSLLGMEHLVNTITKWPDLHNGQRLPILIRMLVGRGWGQGPSHSQSLHGMFTQIPGLRVRYPVQTHLLGRRFLGEYRDSGPTVILEPRRVYDLDWRPCLFEPPADVSLITVGDIALDATEAQRLLARNYGIQARLQTVEDLWNIEGQMVTGGAPAVICDSTSPHYPIYLRGLISDAPTAIVAPPNTPCPTAPDLEAAWYPTAGDIVNAALRLLGRPERVSEQQEASAPDMERVETPF